MIVGIAIGITFGLFFGLLTRYLIQKYIDKVKPTGLTFWCRKAVPSAAKE